MKVYCLGIDEAGRGPVIGNLYIVGVLIEKNNLDKLEDEIKDSKELEHEKRVEIFNKYKKVKYFVKEIKPFEIDKNNLNQLEAEYFKQIIEETLLFLNKKEKEFKLVVYIDLPEKKEKFLKRINLNKSNVELILEHKADRKYKIVSLASIFAKVFREEHVKKLKEDLKLEFGSGYPSDPLTQNFIEKMKKDKKLFEKVKPYIRKKWNTVNHLFNKKITDFLRKK